jgi:hypothetical protein
MPCLFSSYGTPGPFTGDKTRGGAGVLGGPSAHTPTWATPGLAVRLLDRASRDSVGARKTGLGSRRSSGGFTGISLDRSWTRLGLALLMYVGVFCAILLPKVLPLRSGRFLSNSPADGAIFLWSIGWWPYAVAHGIVLPYTHALFAPAGTNLVWTTSIPVPSLILWPVTRAFGTFATFNALSILAPVGAATATYLLVHRVTRRWWPSFVAGLLFALSPLETTELALGHLNLTLVALLPLAAYLVVRHLEGSIHPAVFVLSLGFVLGAQLGTSSEVFLTMTLFGAIAILLLYILDRRLRPALRRCVMLVGLAYLVGGGLGSPMLFTALALPHPNGVSSIGRSTVAPMSGVRTVFGSRPVASAAGTPRAATGVSRGAVALLQLPLIAVLLHLAWTGRRGPVTRALAATALIAAVCAAGVVVVGSSVLPTPWSLAAHVPLLRLVRPQRVTMFVWLIGAVGAGVWLATRRRTAVRLGVALLVIVAALPALWRGSWTSSIPTAPFLGAGGLGLTAGANVLVVAGPGGPGSHQLEDLAVPAVWQMESRFSFRLADAYVGSLPPPLPPAVRRLVFDQPLLPGDAAAILPWLRRAGVRAVLLMHPTRAAVARVQGLLRAGPAHVHGLVLFRVAEAQPLGAAEGP